MRRLMVVLLWVLATAVVTIAANAAVRLVDLQVFPEGASIQVLSTTTTTTMPPTTTLPPPTTTLPPPTTTLPPPTTTLPPPTTTLPPPTTTLPPPTTTLPPPTTTRPPDPLIISTDSIPGGTTGGTYFVVLNGSGGVPPRLWLLDEGTLPPGLELLPSGVIRGTPLSAGAFSFTLRLEDSRGVVAGERFGMELVDPLVIDTTFLPAATVTRDYQVSLVASGGAAPYSWHLVDGVLPDSLGLNEAGLLAGMVDQSGPIEFTVGVTDGDGRVTNRGLSLTTLWPLVILTSSLPTGITGTDYAFWLTGSGGGDPYTWEISNGSLPTGLTLSTDGEIAGIPTVATDASVTIRLTDSAGRVAAFPYRLNVSAGGTRQIIDARGGTVKIDASGDTLVLVEVMSNDGFTGYIVAWGPDKIQVHFVGTVVDVIPSWVLCEGAPEPTCQFD